ncbi:MAG: hypothetical protein QOH84_200 [Kribbellaceae bacterium]|nr:hypothetical protein [Kribbellaceae bacterium]
MIDSRPACREPGELGELAAGTGDGQLDAGTP